MVKVVKSAIASVSGGWKLRRECAVERKPKSAALVEALLGARSARSEGSLLSWSSSSSDMGAMMPRISSISAVRVAQMGLLT